VNIDPVVIAMAVPLLVGAGDKVGRLIRGDKEGEKAREADKLAFQNAINALTAELDKLKKEIRELLLAVTRAETLDERLADHEKRIRRLERERASTPHAGVPIPIRREEDS
jgi:hypothetical protein